MQVRATLDELITTRMRQLAMPAILQLKSNAHHCLEEQAPAQTVIFQSRDCCSRSSHVVIVCEVFVGIPNPLCGSTSPAAVVHGQLVLALAQAVTIMNCLIED